MKENIEQKEMNEPDDNYSSSFGSGFIIMVVAYIILSFFSDNFTDTTHKAASAVSGMIASAIMVNDSLFRLALMLFAIVFTIVAAIA